MEMKAWLMNPFTRENITDDIFQMNPLGSPSPDGFLAQFYQKHWEVVGEQVCNFALKVLNQGGSLNEVNDTFISLIPKVKNLKRVTDYRPISLCNVVYKIVSKTLANRLKVILPKLISINQSDFVPGRLISDNTLVAYEILHSMTSRMKGKRGFMALKLDMSKAYDRVEWKFVEAIMTKMEALIALLNQVEASGVLTPIPIGRGPISMNHLFFTDDSLLFCQAEAEELSYVLNILDIYEKASRQWKKPILQELFSQQEIDDITAIPISLGGREDKLAWQFTANGIYTVKSGYNLSKELECDLEWETAGKAKEKQVWKTIWKLRVSPATKMFLWRACNEALSTLANLRRRKVVEHSSCLVCGQEPETSGHVLWGCIGAKDVWGQAVRKVQKLSFQSDLIFEVWSRLVEILSLEELDEVAVTRGVNSN
ncbi:hypothetical protein F2P56_026813 [Juglans regia]|uniref:Reverse transcriptase domain-containing protein n=2 Tax=Juglans regia TaxID=51240 RepID=A0A833WIY8_JUGRE|nr:uncharacterized protein LOC108985901 [Juglans regia]KAF5451733.1 hypothetical protein F2P56_026813 [Juglans regia]